MLLISGSVPGERVAGHRNVIDAAKAAGVTKLVYTSAPKATTADFALAPDHKATEEAIAASGVPAVLLRNNWYIENYAADVSRAASTGIIAASVGDGRVAGATRADFAEAAAVVLLEDGHVGEVYELGGDTAFGYDELAAAASAVLGREVAYQRLTTDEHVAALEGAGSTRAWPASSRASTRRSAAACSPTPTAPCRASSAGRRRSLVDGLRAVVEVEERPAA